MAGFGKYFGFTLAEVLITLGIIGIVAAMTLPSLLYTQKKKETVTRLQKAIATLNEAHKLSYNELGEPSFEKTTTIDSKEYFDTYWAPYLKIAQYCQQPRECGYSTYTPFYRASGNASGWYIVEPRLRTTFMTTEGFVYTIFQATWKNDGGGEKQNKSEILVDLNGAKPPNRFGTDVFWLTRSEENDGAIHPYGMGLSDREIDKECSTIGEGLTCAEKIKRAGWKIVPGYPFY